MINRQHAAIGGAEYPAEPVDPVEESGDGVWDEEKSQALRQARKDAELTVGSISTDWQGGAAQRAG
jgi:hypothetical protein